MLFRSGRPRCRGLADLHRHPKGYTLVFNVRGKDYRYDDKGVILPFDTRPMYGVGPFSHENPVDRPPEVFHTNNHLHFGPGHQPYVLLPIIPQA